MLSVCATCAGNACNGQGTCPWTSTVAANVTALGTGAAITLAALLPVKILRLFPRPVLESISALSVRTLDVFDPSGKPISEILAAVKHGRFTREDAIAHMAERGTAVDPAQDTAPHQLRQFEFAVKALEATKKTLANTSSSTEVHCFMFCLSSLRHFAVRVPLPFALIVTRVMGHPALLALLPSLFRPNWSAQPLRLPCFLC